MRKRLVAGASVAIGIMLAIGFSRAQSPSEVTLLFWPGPESEAMQKVLDGYNKGAGTKDGVSVKQILFSRQGYFEKEETDLAAGSSEFDLGLITTYTLGRYAPYLAPIDGYLNKTAMAVGYMSISGSIAPNTTPGTNAAGFGTRFASARAVANPISP